MDLKIGLAMSFILYMCMYKYRFFFHFPCNLKWGKKPKLLLFMKVLETCKNAINPNGFTNYMYMYLYVFQVVHRLFFFLTKLSISVYGILANKLHALLEKNTTFNQFLSKILNIYTRKHCKMISM